MLNAEITIERSPEIVWSYFTEPRNWEKWRGGLKAAQWCEGGKLEWALGGSSTIETFNPGRMVQVGGSWMSTTFTFESNESGKTVVKIQESSPKGGASFSDGGASHLAQLNSSLAKLKEHIESTQNTGGDLSVVETNSTSLNMGIPGSNEQAKKIHPFDIMMTVFLSAGLLAVSWQLSFFFVKMRAGESIVLSAIGLIFVSILCFVFYEVGRHGSIRIATLQSFILTFCVTFPLCTREPGLEPIITPLFFSVIGGILTAVSIITFKNTSIAPSIKARLIGTLCLIVGVVVFALARGLPDGMPFGLVKWAFDLISIYLVIFVSPKKIIKGT